MEMADMAEYQVIKNKRMYYSKDYIKAEEKAFEKIGGSAFYTKKSLQRFLGLEGEFVIDISDMFAEQEKRFPYAIIKDFLRVYPKLSTPLKTRYRIEKNFILRSLENEQYLRVPIEKEIDLFTEYYEKGYNLGGETAIEDVKTAFTGSDNKSLKKLSQSMGISFNLTDPEVKNQLRWQAGRRIAGINDTTKRLIINALIGAYDNGSGYDGMKKELKTLFESWQVKKGGQVFTNKRAETIARTELGQSVSWARAESYRRRDVRRKSWLAEPKACPVCVLGVADGIIAFTTSFSNGFLTPLAHPNCRCALLPEVDIQDYLKGYTWHGEPGNAIHTQT